MLVPEDFRDLLLISIPKGPRVSVRNFENYRAVALTSVLGKILDNTIANTQKEGLVTSNQQFGYKSNLSTIICSSLIIDTIQYFTSVCSPAIQHYLELQQ